MVMSVPVSQGAKMAHEGIGPLRAALVGVTPAVYACWAEALEGQPNLLKVNGVYMKTEAEAQAFNEQVFRGQLLCFFDKSAPTAGAHQQNRQKNSSANSTSRNLDALVASPAFDVLLVGLPPPSHQALIQKVLKTSKKHILSLTPPTRSSKELAALLADCHRKNFELGKEVDPNNPIILEKSIGGRVLAEPAPLQRWSVAELMRSESAFNKVAIMMRDIGPVLGGSLVVTTTDTAAQMDAKRQALSREAAGRSTNNSTQQQSALANKEGQILFDTAVSVTAVLRRIIGEVDCVNVGSLYRAAAGRPGNGNGPSAASAGGERGDAGPDCLAGQIFFAGGTAISTNIALSCDAKLWSLRLWGASGKIDVNYDFTKNLYECQRSLKHFEFPSRHAFTGYHWCIQSFCEAVLTGKRDSSSPTDNLVDLAVTEAMFESKGGNVMLRC